MASKLQFISELADWTAHVVTQNVDGWKSYLATAARLYKMYAVKGGCEVSPNTT